MPQGYVSPNDPIVKAETVVLDTPFSNVSRQIIVTVEGALTVVFEDDTQYTYPKVFVGEKAIAIKEIKAAGTTATVTTAEF